MMRLVSQYLHHLTCRHSSALTRLTWGGFAGPWERVGLLPRPEMKIVTAVCVDQPTEGMVQRLQMSRAARAAREASSDHSRSCILSERLCACPRSLSLSAPCRHGVRNFSTGALPQSRGIKQLRDRRAACRVCQLGQAGLRVRLRYRVGSFRVAAATGRRRDQSRAWRRLS